MLNCTGMPRWIAPAARSLKTTLLAVTLGLSFQTIALADRDGGHWVSTWGDVAVGIVQAPSNQTIREIERISLGGNWFRVRLSNEFNPTSISLGEAHIALAGLAGATIPFSDRQLTFGGQSSIVIPPDSAIYSDPVHLTVPSLGKVAVSLYLPANAGMVTMHPFAVETAYITNGNAAASSSPGGAVKSLSRFMLSEIQVYSDEDASAIVTLGDSITEGDGSTVDEDRRWPDVLADRLAAAHGIGPRGVNDAGIGGNRVLNDTVPSQILPVNLGQAALARLDRDVLAQAGVKYLILLEGVNDLTVPAIFNLPQQTITADQLIGAYRQIIARAHAHGVKVIGGTILPFGAIRFPNAFTPATEAMREAVNKFILESGEFDGAIDFATAVADPKNPTFLAAQFDSGDGVHPNNAGHAAMANAIDLSLFKGFDQIAEHD
jgi:lysophospholipase L1-like esterase